MSTSELAEHVGISQPKNMRRRYLRLLLDMGLVEYTIPQKPNSRLQKYRLTEKGFAWESISKETLSGAAARKDVILAKHGVVQ